MTKCMKMNIKCLEVLDFYKKIFIKLENIYINIDMVLKANNLSCYIKKLNRIFMPDKLFLIYLVFIIISD